MDCRLWGDVLLLPDQMQVINPLEIVVFVLLFESVIYPYMARHVELT